MVDLKAQRRSSRPACLNRATKFPIFHDASHRSLLWRGQARRPAQRLGHPARPDLPRADDCVPGWRFHPARV